MAMRDATQQKAYYDTERIVDKKHLLDNEEAKERVKQYIDQIMDGKHPAFEGAENDVEESFRKYLGEDYAEFTFGNTQKLINMTVKYMFIACYQNSHLAECFSGCHCPMDSIMIEKVIGMVNKHNCEKDVKEEAEKLMEEENVKMTWRAYLRQPWSRIGQESKTFNQYKLFQWIVSYLAAKESIKPIEFDFKYWPDSEAEDNENTV